MEQTPLVVLTGPPGAGKTSVARLVATRFERAACVLESDWWWTTLVNGRIDPWRSDAHDQNRAVVSSFFAAAAAMVQGGYPTVLEGVVGPWMLDLLVAGSAPVHYVVLRPTLEETLRRATGRVGEERVPGHPALTDEEPVMDMWEQFAALGELEPHAIDTTLLDAEQTAETVWARVQQGALLLGGADGASPEAAGGR